MQLVPSARPRITKRQRNQWHATARANATGRMENDFEVNDRNEESLSFASIRACINKKSSYTCETRFSRETNESRFLKTPFAILRLTVLPVVTTARNYPYVAVLSVPTTITLQGTVSRKVITLVVTSVRRETVKTTHDAFLRLPSTKVENSRWWETAKSAKWRSNPFKAYLWLVRSLVSPIIRPFDSLFNCELERQIGKHLEIVNTIVFMIYIKMFDRKMCLEK